MFEEVEKSIAVPQWVAVPSAVLGGFGLGLWVGKLIAGGKPFDWTLDIVNAVFLVGWTIWFGSKAVANRRR